MASSAWDSGEHFRQIADNLPIVLALTNAELSQFLFVNRAYEQIWGRKVESLYANALSFVEGVHAKDRQRLLEALDGLKKGQAIEGIECLVERPDGTTCSVFCRGFPVRNADGEIVGLVGSAEDITEWRRTETALRESEDRYRDLVEHSSDLICTHDTQGILLSVNEAPLRILGYAREELLNKPLRDFVTEEAKGHCDEYLERVRRDGFARGLLPVLTKSGEVRLWEYNNSLREDGVSAPTVRGIAHDVTEQKRAEVALRRSEEKFAKAFRSSPIGMVIATLEEGRLLDANETFARESGYSREELLGRTTLELGLWIEARHRAAIVEEVKKHGRITNREVQTRTKSGEVQHKLFSAELLHIGGQPCLLTVGEDITERKRAQEKLMRSEAFLAEGQRISHTGSWSWNPATGEIFWSQEMYRIFEATPESAKPSLELILRYVHPEDRQVFERMSERVVREARETEGDYRLLLPSGRLKYVHCESQPAFDAGGRLVEFVGTIMDVSARRETEEELGRLSGQLMRLHDQERRNIARDLHDSTGQGLVALTATLSQAQSSIPSSNRKARKLIAEALAVAKECLREVRTLSYVLYPPILEHAGLVDAIREFREGFVKRTGIEVKVRIAPGFERLEREKELALFRVMQESLVNVHRHSGSPSVEIVLGRQTGLVVLEVRDQGCGMPNKRNGEVALRMGVGIASMQERVKQVGGRLEIKSGAGGTTVCAAVPVNGQKTAGQKAGQKRTAASHPAGG
jgi:PAS domain S-box-containing protein